MKLRLLTSATILSFLLLTFTQCKKDDNPDVMTDPATSITDQELYDMTSTVSGYIYYKNDNTVLESSPESAHKAYFRVRFNEIAYEMLTDNGKLPDGSEFPDGALIVKELHNSADGSNEGGIAVMLKSADDANADENGWVWAEYFGSVDNRISVSDKGSACISCHSTNDRDRVRLFNLFP